jgi:PilZ domain
MLPRPEEQRRYLRHPMHRAAEVRFGTQRQRVRCKIRDMSDGGARLAVSHPIASLPSTFTLVLFKDASVQRDCEVVWTDSRYVGVKFISDWYGVLKPKRRVTGAGVPHPS